MPVWATRRPTEQRTRPALVPPRQFIDPEFANAAMKITFVLPYAGLQGGIRVVATHAAHLSARGHQVSVVSLPQMIPARRKLKSLLLGRGWPTPEPSSYFEGVSVDHHILDSVRSVTDADVPDADVV